MKNILFTFLSLVTFFACANVEKSEKPAAASYIGVDVPDFKNDAIDSLVVLYESDRAIFYQAQAKNDMESYYKHKIATKDGYNVTGFYDDVIKILNAGADTTELRKFQDYIKDSSAKSREFMGKVKK